MKKITYIFLVFLCLKTYSQTPIISMTDYKNNNTNLVENSYLKDIDNKYGLLEGTWQWSNSNDSLILIFEKIEFVYDGFNYSDILIGKYKYIKNGVELINTLNNNINNSNFWLYTSTILYTSGYNNESDFEFVFYDKLKNKHCSILFELQNTDYLPNGQIYSNEAILEIWEEEKINSNNNSIGFTFPNEATLIKQ